MSMLHACVLKVMKLNLSFIVHNWMYICSYVCVCIASMECRYSSTGFVHIIIKAICFCDHIRFMISNYVTDA